MSDDIRPRFKLGRIRPKVRRPTLRLAAYLDHAIAASTLPASTNYAAKAGPSLKQIYMNDQLGCCVISGKFHALGVWSGNDSGTPIVATDQEVVSAYHTICGPGDNGCNIGDVLDYWKASGIKMGGQVHKIDAYVEVDPSNQDEVKAAIYLFTGLPLGLNLPSAWENVDDGGIWDVPSGFGARIVGGHDVEAVDFNETGVVISTWGGLRTITWAAMANSRYVEEAYAVLSPDWYGSDKLAPCGLDVATLQADLAKLGGGVIPSIDPPAPVPTPTPVPVGPTLDEVIRAVAAGIASLAPYEGENVVDQVSLAAISALQSVWASGGS